MLGLVELPSFSKNNDEKSRLVELTVNPETGPFLVSSFDSLMWVRAGQRQQVRAAIRPLPEGGVPEVFRQVIQEVVDTGVEANWGNVIQLSADGLREAVARIGEYDLGDYKIYVNPDDTFDFLAGQETVPVPGIPSQYVVVAPADPSLTGVVFVSQRRFFVLVHNASRAIAVLR